MTVGLPSPRPLPQASDIKLIISDVDGTLLDSHHRLPTSNPTCQILQRLRRTHPNLPIIISTGKQHRSTAELRELLDLYPFPCCHVNGNVLYTADGTIISETALRWETVRKAYKSVAAHHATFFLYDHSIVYQVSSGLDDTAGDRWATALRGYGEDVRRSTIDELEAAGTTIIKVAICQEEAELATTRAALAKQEVEGGYAIVQALTFCAELIPRAYNKGTALVSLLKYMKTELGQDIDVKNVIAFGDGENDISMFGVAGMSVAMGNAMQKAKDVAVWETVTNDEGGVGRFLEEVFFPVPN